MLQNVILLTNFGNKVKMLPYLRTVHLTQNMKKNVMQEGDENDIRS